MKHFDLSVMIYINPFPNDQFLRSSKMREFADDNFEFDENGRKFSKRVENTVRKGEIARYVTLTASIETTTKECRC